MQTQRRTDAKSVIVRKAFLKSLPVMAGYIVLGIGFGILLRNAGYGTAWSVGMAVLIYAGSMQYVGIGLLAGGAGILTTILSKGLILLLNFAVIVLTTQLWKAEGRGVIAIFTADIGLIAFFANVFTGNSASYYFSRFSSSKLATAAYLWSFLVSALGGLFLLATGQLQTAPFVFVVSTLLGIITFHNSLFVGDQRINHYNLITLLQPALLILCMLLFHWIRPQLGFYCYFLGQIVSLSALIALSTALKRRMGIRFHWDFDRACNRQLFNYGWKTELSNVLQFFNYRLTYYMLAYYLGKGSVGIFSIGVSVAEASWIVSRSVSLVLFSNVLTQGNTPTSRRDTLLLALLSLGCLLSSSALSSGRPSAWWPCSPLACWPSPSPTCSTTSSPPYATSTSCSSGRPSDCSSPCSCRCG